jgi:uncharacterized membrane protein YvbJ
MFCRTCGKEVSEADAFCASCGRATSPNVVVQQLQPVASTSVTKVALGVLLGMVALIVLLIVIGNVGADGVVIIALGFLAILVAGGVFRKQLR